MSSASWLHYLRRTALSSYHGMWHWFDPWWREEFLANVLDQSQFHEEFVVVILVFKANNGWGT